jgi:hypothetical protein
MEDGVDKGACNAIEREIFSAGLDRVGDRRQGDGIDLQTEFASGSISVQWLIGSGSRGGHRSCEEVQGISCEI